MLLIDRRSREPGAPTHSGQPQDAVDLELPRGRCEQRICALQSGGQVRTIPREPACQLRSANEGLDGRISVFHGQCLWTNVIGRFKKRTATCPGHAAGLKMWGLCGGERALKSADCLEGLNRSFHSPRTNSMSRRRPVGRTAVRSYRHLSDWWPAYSLTGSRRGTDVPRLLAPKCRS